MSVQNNPIILSFGMTAADSNHPTSLDFKIHNADQNPSFHMSSTIRPVIQANTYIHNQNQASDTWVITHTLHKFPSVTIVDSAGTVVVGDVQYIDEDNIICTFKHEFSGMAYLN